MNEVMTERKMKMTDAALNIICDALKLDKEYYETWKANIADAFVEAYTKQGEVYSVHSKKSIRELSDTAADNFLQSLINEHHE